MEKKAYLKSGFKVGKNDRDAFFSKNMNSIWMMVPFKLEFSKHLK